MPKFQARKKAPRSTDGWLSVRHAAHELGVTYATVLQRAVAGHLKTQQVAGRTFVSRESIERYLEESVA